jgi:hypothetical protein
MSKKREDMIWLSEAIALFQKLVPLPASAPVFEHRT